MSLKLELYYLFYVLHLQKVPNYLEKPQKVESPFRDSMLITRPHYNTAPRALSS